MLAYKNILGLWIFDEKLNMIDKSLFKPEEAIEKIKDETAGQALIQKHNARKQLIKEEAKKILAYFEKNHIKEFYLPNILMTKKSVKDSIGYDNLIIQTTSHIEELNKIINMLSKRLREWYSLYHPELSNSLDSYLAFSREVVDDKKEKPKGSMGADLPKEDIEPMKKIAQQILDIDSLREKQTEYLETIMKKHCPNIQAVAGTLIGGKLILLSGGLDKLSKFPSSTVQLLGAEKALFRHIKTGARPPKFGVIMNHYLVNSVRSKQKGRVARVLANKISLAAKIDRFKGEFIGDKLIKALEEQVKKEAEK